MRRSDLEYLIRLVVRDLGRERRRLRLSQPLPEQSVDDFSNVRLRYRARIEKIEGILRRLRKDLDDA